MKINYKITFLSAIAIFLLLATSCRKNDAQLIPALPGTTHGLLLIAGTNDTITISNGKAPYKVTVTDTAIAKATVLNQSAAQLVIYAIKGGSTIVTVTGADGGKTNFELTVEDSYKSIQLNDTLRFMQPGSVTIYNNTTPDIHIYRDKGITFGNAKNKFGWAADDGQNFVFLEFTGSPDALGVKTDATLYTRVNGGVPVRVACAKAEIIQIKSGIVWIVYQQTQGGALGVMVQKQWVDGL